MQYTVGLCSAVDCTAAGVHAADTGSAFWAWLALVNKSCSIEVPVHVKTGAYRSVLSDILLQVVVCKGVNGLVATSAEGAFAGSCWNRQHAGLSEATWTLLVKEVQVVSGLGEHRMRCDCSLLDCCSVSLLCLACTSSTSSRTSSLLASATYWDTGVLSAFLAALFKS